MSEYPLKTWLDILCAIAPIQGALLVGTGNGNGSLLQWIQQHTTLNASLVVADKSQFRYFQKNLPENPDSLLPRDTGISDNSPLSFYPSSNIAESSVLSTSSLQNLWPGLQPAQANDADGDIQSGVNLADLLSEQPNLVNWLILDCLPACPLLQGAGLALERMDIVILRVVVDESLVDPSSHYSSANHLMQQAGFYCIHRDPERHPALALALYVRNSREDRALILAEKISRLQLENELETLNQAQVAAETSATEQLAAAQQKIEQLTQAQVAAATTAKEQLAAAKQKNEQLTQAQEATAHAAAEQLAAAQQKIEQLTQARDASASTAAQCAEEHQTRLLKQQEQLNSALVAKTGGEKSLADNKAQFDLLNKEYDKSITLDKKLDLLLIEQKNHINNLQRDLAAGMTRGFANSVKQIESFISIQNYFEHGTSPLSFHGWPISPDVALFLLGIIEDNNYAFIIEFGSGTSTALFAKALLKKQRANSLTSEQEPNIATFQKNIITFEHNKYFFEQTLKDLQKQNLDQFVDIVYAPLLDYCYNEESYFYYSCEKKLNQLSKSLKRQKAKILVLVDGPPGETGPLARFPAIPHLFKYLEHHQLDIIIDDYNRKEEKTIAEKWKEIFAKRNIKYVEEIIPCEKGALLLRIN